MFNQTLTIVNKWFNKTTKLYEYKLTNINGFFSSKQGISINNTILSTSDGFIARILMSEPGYKTPKEYQALTSTSGYWTLQNDDYIVKGTVTGAITKISDLESSYEEVMKITNIEIKDYSSNDMKHYAISGE